MRFLFIAMVATIQAKFQILMLVTQILVTLMLVTQTPNRLQHQCSSNLLLSIQHQRIF